MVGTIFPNFDVSVDGFAAVAVFVCAQARNIPDPRIATAYAFILLLMKFMILNFKVDYFFTEFNKEFSWLLELFFGYFFNNIIKIDFNIIVVFI
ncbi:hypothetical protein GCM10023210_27360 [Chryseobacterium ginsengisoli]|uniref:Uncharacterized protein n=1 Tax=Chryseobacterium ginsengisoli TaxID=363853 RepID=A0ABP9MHC1_9FLAO